MFGFKFFKKDKLYKCLTKLTDGKVVFMPRVYTVTAPDMKTAFDAFVEMDKHPQEVIKRVELASVYDKIPNNELGVVSQREMQDAILSHCGF